MIMKCDPASGAEMPDSRVPPGRPPAVRFPQFRTKFQRWRIRAIHRWQHQPLCFAVIRYFRNCRSNRERARHCQDATNPAPVPRSRSSRRRHRT